MRALHSDQACACVSILDMQVIITAAFVNLSTDAWLASDRCIAENGAKTRGALGSAETDIPPADHSRPSPHSYNENFYVQLLSHPPRHSSTAAFITHKLSIVCVLWWDLVERQNVPPLYSLCFTFRFATEKSLHQLHSIISLQPIKHREPNRSSFSFALWSILSDSSPQP